MNGQGMRVRNLSYFRHCFKRYHAAVRQRVFKAYKRRGRFVYIVRPYARGYHLRHGYAVRVVNLPYVHAAEHRRGANFVHNYVALRPGDYFIPAPRLAHYAYLVAHCSARCEHGRLLAQHLGRKGFKLVHGGVVAVYVVANLRCGHCSTHGKGGLGNGVASKVDVVHIILPEFVYFQRISSITGQWSLPVTSGSMLLSSILCLNRSLTTK